jgi:hypothetical protein
VYEAPAPRLTLAVGGASGVGESAAASAGSATAAAAAVVASGQLQPVDDASAAGDADVQMAAPVVVLSPQQLAEQSLEELRAAAAALHTAPPPTAAAPLVAGGAAVPPLPLALPTAGHRAPSVRMLHSHFSSRIAPAADRALTIVSIVMGVIVGASAATAARRAGGGDGGDGVLPAGRDAFEAALHASVSVFMDAYDDRLDEVGAWDDVALRTLLRSTPVVAAALTAALFGADDELTAAEMAARLPHVQAAAVYVVHRRMLPVSDVSAAGNHATRLAAALRDAVVNGLGAVVAADALRPHAPLFLVTQQWCKLLCGVRGVGGFFAAAAAAPAASSPPAAVAGLLAPTGCPAPPPLPQYGMLLSAAGRSKLIATSSNWLGSDMVDWAAIAEPDALAALEKLTCFGRPGYRPLRGPPGALHTLALPLLAWTAGFLTKDVASVAVRRWVTRRQQQLHGGSSVVGPAAALLVAPGRGRPSPCPPAASCRRRGRRARARAVYMRARARVRTYTRARGCAGGATAR